jgi:thioredoxin 1
MALLDDKNFGQQIKSGVSVVKFYSLWNMESRSLEQPFRELSEEFRGRAKFIVSEINANQILARNEGITKIPTVAIYVNGAPVAKMTHVTKRQLRDNVAYFLKKSESI